MPAGHRTGFHAHPGDEHHVVLAGRVRITQGESVVEAGPGDYVLLGRHPAARRRDDRRRAGEAPHRLSARRPLRADSTRRLTRPPRQARAYTLGLQEGQIMPVEQEPDPTLASEIATQPPREEAFRLLIEAVQDYAIFLLGPDGRVRTWNPGAERAKGYTASEIIGQHFSVFYTPEEREAGRPQVAARQGRGGGEGRGRGLAGSQGRHPVLGGRHPYGAPRRERRSVRVREDHARPDRAPARGRAAAQPHRRAARSSRSRGSAHRP